MTNATTASEQAVSYILGSNASEYQVAYSPPSMVDAFSSLPRFSHNDDFSKLFSDDPEEVRDYSMGLLFLAMFIISFFTVWALFLCLFKCIGPKYLGVLAGFPFKREGYKSRIGRVTLIFSSLSVIVLAIIVVTKGLTELQATSDTISLTNQDVIKIHKEFSDIAANLRSVSKLATPIRDQLVSFLQQDICPLQPGTGTETTIRAVGADTFVAVSALQNFVADQLDEVDVALEQVDRATTDINNAVSQAQFNDAKVTAIMIPYFIIPAFLVVAVTMGWNDVFSEGYFTFVTWFIVPFMCLMTAFAFVAAGWVVVSIEGNSDFCSPNPESTIDMILQQYNLQSGQLYYDWLMFYVQQCNVDVVTNPWTFMEVYYDQLTQAKAAVRAFTDTVVSTTPEQLSQECGVEYAPILDLLRSLAAHTGILLDSSDRAMDLVSCPAIVPLFTHAVYDATCRYSVVGANWIFSCTLLMSFFGMLCIMFRGAYYPIGYFYYVGADGSKSLYGTSESELDESDGQIHDDDDDDEEEEEDDDNVAHNADRDEGALPPDGVASDDDHDDDGNALGNKDPDGYKASMMGRRGRRRLRR